MDGHVEGLLEQAEGFVAAGRFAPAAECVERIAVDVSALDRPDLLARASWVAAVCALAQKRTEEFKNMAEVAARAVELATDGEAHQRVAALSRRVAAIALLGGDGDLDAGVQRVLADHVALLRRLASGSEPTSAWQLADADRTSWPHLFAAIRAASGRSCFAERTILSAGGDAIIAVVIAVLIGLGDDRLEADALAALCFRDDGAVSAARARIDDLVARGVLDRSGNSVSLVAATGQGTAAKAPSPLPLDS